VADFQPRRSQRRAWQKNRDVRVIKCVSSIRQEHFSLYQRYLVTRHRGGGMDDSTYQQYIDFLSSAWCETDFWEFRLAEKLLAVVVLDRLEDGLSAVYTFFDPDYAQRSLGVFTILWSIQETRRQGLDWLYLGYWIASSPKMRYKSEYQPQEHFQHGRWTPAEHTR
jgi:arginine-tRNA-protein transferase